MDEYDKAIATLLARDDFDQAVFHAWNFPYTSSSGCLFKYVTPDGGYENCVVNGETCGCLTQVKSGEYFAYTKTLTKRIRADPELPSSVDGITKENIHKFAEWQRELDRTIRKKGYKDRQ